MQIIEEPRQQPAPALGPRRSLAGGLEGTGRLRGRVLDVPDVRGARRVTFNSAT